MIEVAKSRVTGDKSSLLSQFHKYLYKENPFLVIRQMVKQHFSSPQVKYIFLSLWLKEHTCKLLSTTELGCLCIAQLTVRSSFSVTSTV